MSALASLRSMIAHMASAARVLPQDVFPPVQAQAQTVWFRCSDIDQFTAAEILRDATCELAPDISVIITLPNCPPELAGRVWSEPRSKRAIANFVSAINPLVTVWFRDGLNSLLLTELHSRGIPCILVDASAENLEKATSGWVRGAMASQFGQFERILTTDQDNAGRLIFAGAPEDIVTVMGELEDSPPVMPCDEDERTEVTAALGTRPVWLAAGAHLYDWEALADAQSKASKRAHRLLLVVVPADLHHAVDFIENFRERGLRVCRQSKSADPSDTCQVYVVDEVADLGLWYRVAPITYMGGSLFGDSCRDPFEPAALGSSVIYGPLVAPYQRRAARLNAVGGSRLIRSAKDLAESVEKLLSPDASAQQAHAAWDVTTQGSEVTLYVADLITAYAEKAR